MRSRPDGRPARGSGSDRLTPDVRQKVLERDLYRCVRCGGPPSEVHHRRTKSVRDEHTHAPENLVSVCGWGNTKGCHGWIHSNPRKATEDGLIVSRYCDDPGGVEVRTWRGTVRLRDNGSVELKAAPS